MDLDGLRERNVPQRASCEEDAKKAVQDLNRQSEDSFKEKKTYGRTPDGIGQSRPDDSHIPHRSLAFGLSLLVTEDRQSDQHRLPEMLTLFQSSLFPRHMIWSPSSSLPTSRRTSAT